MLTTIVTTRGESRPRSTLALSLPSPSRSSPSFRCVKKVTTTTQNRPSFHVLVLFREQELQHGGGLLCDARQVPESGDWDRQRTGLARARQETRPQSDEGWMRSSSGHMILAVDCVLLITTCTLLLIAGRNKSWRKCRDSKNSRGENGYSVQLNIDTAVEARATLLSHGKPWRV